MERFSGFKARDVLLLKGQVVRWTPMAGVAIGTWESALA